MRGHWDPRTSVSLRIVVSGEMGTFSNLSKISLASLREETLLASTSSIPWICKTVSADALARTGAMSDTMRSFRRSVGIAGLRPNVIATFPPLVDRHETTSTEGDSEHTWNVQEGKYLIKIVSDKNQEHPQPCGCKSWAECAAKSRGYEGPAWLHVTPHELLAKEPVLRTRVYTGRSRSRANALESDCQLRLEPL